MRAAVARQGMLTCEEIPDVTPAAGQVLVRTLSCGICGSDLHALHHLDHMAELGRRSGSIGGGMDPKAGVVFGHEFSAEVLDYGPGSARPLKPGARVVSMPVIMGPTGGASIGYSNAYPGGFAERMLLSEALMLEVSNGLSSRQAAMTVRFGTSSICASDSSIR